MQTTESDRLEAQHERRERDRWEAEMSRNEPRAELMLSQAFVFRVYKRDADMILRALRGTLSEHEIAPARELSDRLTALRAQAVEQVAVGARIAVAHMNDARARDGLSPDPLSTHKKLAPGSVYCGFTISHSPIAPVTGRWTAERYGVRMSARSADELRHMIDNKPSMLQSSGGLTADELASGLPAKVSR